MEIKQLVKDINSEGVNSVFDYLTKTDFFTAPGSHNYHHSYEGGLYRHCCEVFINLTKLESVMTKEKSLSPEVKFYLAFGHDLSKINFYANSTRNIKINGAWKTVPTYGFVNDPNTFDHETQSMYMLMKLVPNIDFNILQAIKFHHGAFNEGTKNDYSKACRGNELVLLLHTADMMSAIEGDHEMDKIRSERGY